MNYTIEEMKSYHWEEVKNIYIEGINTGIATFQTESDLPTWEEWNNNHISSCRLVACFENNILGFVALTPISNRPVYCGVAELSLYISEKYKEQGIGTALLTNLIKLSEENGYWPTYHISEKRHQSLFNISDCKEYIDFNWYILF